MYQYGGISPCLINPWSLSYIVPALSSAVTTVYQTKILFSVTLKERQLHSMTFQDFENEILKFHDFLGFSWPVRTPWDSLWVISNETEVTAIAMEETTISKNGHRIAIPIKFTLLVVPWRQRNLPRSVPHIQSFSLLLFIFSFVSIEFASSILHSTILNAWQFIENWWFDGKCRTKKMSAGSHTEAPFSRLKLFPWLDKCWNTPVRIPQIKSFPKEALESVTTSTCGYIAWNTCMFWFCHQSMLAC